MTAKTLRDDNWTRPINDKTVYIVGPGQLQNSLMASSLNQAIEAECLAVESLEKVSSQDDGDGNQKYLALLDCLGKDCESCLLDCGDLTGEKAFFSFPSSQHWLALQRKIRYRFKCDLYLYNKKRVEKIFNQLTPNKFMVDDLKRDFFVTVNLT